MTSYDDVPYDCHPIPGTAPEQLAMTSIFHGGPQPPVTPVRYLEIGCGDGANLLPLAYHRPESHFIGVDASEVQIAAGRDSAARLDTQNVALHAADIRETAADLPVFDYVVAHGVMSWVSRDVRNEIFRLSREHLAPHGVFYTSFNTYPGWTIRGMVRDLLLRQTASAATLKEQAETARSVADFLMSKIQRLDHPYAQLLFKELQRVTECANAYLVHEYLEGHNQAFWLHEFVALAKEFGFQYVADAGYNQPNYRVPPPLRDVAAHLESATLQIDQLADLLWYRQHRIALFCRDDRAMEPARPAIPGAAQLASGLQPYSGHGLLGPDMAEVFHGYFEADFRIELNDPLAKAALATLGQRWPDSLTVEALLHESADRLVAAGLPRPNGDDRERLEALLLDLHVSGQVDMRLRGSPQPVDVTDRPRPVACNLTRWEAERRWSVTTAQHHGIGLSLTDRLLIGHLDGRLDRDAIAHEVSSRLQSGTVHGRQGELVAGNAAAPGRVAQILDHLLAVLGGWGLLNA